MANRAGGKEVERRKEMEGSAHESSNEPNLYERARSQSHPLTPPNTVFLLLPYISTVFLQIPGLPRALPIPGSPRRRRFRGTRQHMANRVPESDGLLP